ncbi:microsomal signal peptidase 25 kDa subunit-domain-containing protein [Schizothecium vesticola]|uniref:Signal peptidase complex subunit 2 n=1 Tax=Schizothecium vesticola TaxID=314040 RepID=A0AA40KA06_9PEZI|nr:microsomal signal peptidase 25 kDa subunit-domain-containing protein [Schizothecium vesticola]
MSQQEKISVYNLADLKNTTDDAIPNYLNSLGFTQSHTLSDVRLGLGYLALLTAAACFAWDYQLGFEATKLPTAAAVALYAVLNTALTVWIFFVERGAVYVGTSPDGRARVRLTSASVRGAVPEYRLTAEVSDAATGRVRETVEVRRGFNAWFDAAGRFVAAPFQVVLAGQVGVIGQADPKRREAAAAEGKGTTGRVVDESVSAGYTPEMLAALQGAEATGAEAEAGKKGGKRRKA